jgi:hypothetical protein
MAANEDRPVPQPCDTRPRTNGGIAYRLAFIAADIDSVRLNPLTFPRPREECAKLRDAAAEIRRIIEELS